MNQNILDAREERVALQQELLKSHQRPLLIHRVNTPGPHKNTTVSRGIFEMVEAALREQLGDEVLAEKMLSSAEGPIMLRVVESSAATLKEKMILLEDQLPLGRFVDLDVYDVSGLSLSRTQLGLSPRSCYICSAPAHECARSQRHSLEELLKVIENAYLNSR